MNTVVDPAVQVFDGKTVLKARLHLLAFAACAGTGYIMSRMADLDHGTYSFALHAITASALMSIIVSGSLTIKTPSCDVAPILYCGFGTAIVPFLILTASKVVSPSLSAAIVISNALMIAVMSWILGRKRFSSGQVISLFAGFIGVLLIGSIRGAMAGELTGVAYLLMAAFLIATMTIALEKTVKTLGALETTRRVFMISFLVGLVIATLTGDLMFYSMEQSVKGLLFGVMGLGAPVLFFNMGMSVVGAADATSFKLLIPFFAFLYAMILLGEIPDTVSALAEILIVVSVAMYNRN